MREIALHPGPHVRAQDRDHGALVLPDLGPHLVGAGHGKAGEALGQDLARLHLVGRRPVRVDEGNDEGLGSLPLDQPGRLPHELLAIERGVDGAVGQDPLGDLAHAVAGNERGGTCRREVHGARQAKPLDLEHVAEPGRGQKPQRRPVPLDDGVDGDRGAVDQVVDGGGVERPLAHQRAQPVEDAAPGIVGDGGRLEAGELARRLVEEAEVGEGAADVDPQPVTSHVVTCLSRHLGRASPGASRAGPGGCQMRARCVSDVRPMRDGVRTSSAGVYYARRVTDTLATPVGAVKRRRPRAAGGLHAARG